MDYDPPYPAAASPLLEQVRMSAVVATMRRALIAAASWNPVTNAWLAVFSNTTLCDSAAGFVKAS
jgi:hypothetical protein